LPVDYPIDLRQYITMKSIYKLIVILIVFSIFCSSCQTTGRQDSFIVNHRSAHVPLGEFEAQFHPFLSMGGLTKQTVKVFYYPREDAVCIQYVMNFFTYNQFWSRTGRQVFLSALQQYNIDYDERSLTRSRRTIKAYGDVLGYLIWQQFSFSVRARANAKIELGYTFRDRSPYFTINQRETEFIDPESQENYRKSPVVTMYLTRTQAAQIAAFFDQDMLAGFAPAGSAEPDNYDDDYFESEAGSEVNADRDEY